MKKRRLLLFALFSTIVSKAQEPVYDYTFFTNSRMGKTYFYSETSSESSGLKNTGGKIRVSNAAFHTPGNSLELDYTNTHNGDWDATVWREQVRGQDHFKPARLLSAWIFVAGETPAGALPALQLVMADSIASRKQLFNVKRVNAWERVLIPLINLTGEKSIEPRDIIGIKFSQQGHEGKRHKIYIDDLELLPGSSAPAVQSQPALAGARGYAKHIDLRWEQLNDTAIKFIKIYRSTDSRHYVPVGIQSPLLSRYTDWTGRTGARFSYKISFLDADYRESGLSSPLTASTKRMNDEELLDMVQEASFRYYWEAAEINSGLAKENIPGRQRMVASGASGFGMMALIAGTQRGFINRQQSISRFQKILDFLGRADRFHGAFPHFLDGGTGHVEPFFGNRDNGGDLVETSFLFQGLLAVRAYFNRNDAAEKMIRDRITTLWESLEWDWYRQYPDSKFLYWHWSPDQAWVINHKLIGWNETMVTYLLAIASPTHAVPASLYYTGWANRDSTGQKYRSDWGGAMDGSMYTNGNSYYGIKLDVGVSNGGPLFFTHYSYLGYDPHLLRDKYTNYFINNTNIARINYQYCLLNPGKYKGYGEGCWGLTASDGPYEYAANEPVTSRDKGIIAPTGAISSFPYTPVQSMKALKNYYNNYGSFLWGEYGFRDAFDLTRNWCSGIYMGLNQAPMVVMIENFRTGLLWKLFMSDKDVQQGIKKLDRETDRN
jgi:hypothetical protein